MDRHLKVKHETCVYRESNTVDWMAGNYDEL